MKVLLKVLFLAFTITSLLYPMDKKTLNKRRVFKKNFAQLNIELQTFVKDYKTWSQQEQDKIRFNLTIQITEKNELGVFIDPILEIIISKPLIASSRYNNDIQNFIIKNIASVKNEDILIPFYTAINCLTKHPNNCYKIVDSSIQGR